MAYGLTATGFIPKTYEVIRAEIVNDVVGIFGASIDTSDEDPLGQFISIIAERFSLLWELIETVNSGMNPDANTGAQQDAIAAITGTVRDNALPSTVVGTLTGDQYTTVPVDSLTSVEDTEAQFKLTAETQIETLAAAWVGSTVYTLGDIVSNDTPTRIYICTTGGNSGFVGPTGTGEDIVDNDAVWDYVGDGEAYQDGDFESVDTGAIVAVARSLNQIDTPVAGWGGVRNLLDADLGRDIESNEALRIKRETELAASGSGPVDAVRADLLAVDGVTAVTVFNNPTDVTDGDGVPPHAFESLVQGGADQDIWDALLVLCAGAGIYTHGDEVGTADDSQGNSHTMRFSRPDEIDIYVEVTLDYDAMLYPADGDDQVAAAIVAMGDAQAVGKDAVSSRITAACFTVAGVLDVSLAYLDTSPSPASEATIAISTREIAVFDTSRVTVNSSAVTP